jgi:hypothetical protein
MIPRSRYYWRWRAWQRRKQKKIKNRHIGILTSVAKIPTLSFQKGTKSGNSLNGSALTMNTSLIS